MPRGDGMGPRGMGPMTGRGAGFCAGYNTPGYANPMGGRGFGGGGRGGWGYRNMYYATGLPRWARGGYGYPMPNPGWAPWGMGPVAPAWGPEQETEMLKQQAEALNQQMEAINKRLAELEDES